MGVRLLYTLYIIFALFRKTIWSKDKISRRFKDSCRPLYSCASINLHARRCNVLNLFMLLLDDKSTALDMPYWVDWAVKPQHKQTVLSLIFLSQNRSGLSQKQPCLVCKDSTSRRRRYACCPVSSLGVYVRRYRVLRSMYISNKAKTTINRKVNSILL